MTDGTKEIFDAPWEILTYVDEDRHTFLEIYDRFRDRIAGCIEDEETARRFRRLPELYDALKDSTLEICAECIHDNFRMGRIVCDEDYDFIENGCPFPEFSECVWKKCWALLKKVRDGE